MPVMSVTLDGENCWPDLEPEKVVHIDGAAAPPIGVACMEKGMTSGRPSVVLRIDLPDGRTVLAQTSMRLFQTAARMMVARFGDLTEG